LLDVGFGDEDLSEIWDNVDTLDDDHNKEESANSIKETSIKTGDLYELGSHRLMCGDSTELEQVKKLVGDNKINMIYNHPFCEIEDDYFDFVEKTIVNALSVADNNVHVYYWCDEKSIGTIQTLFKNNDIQHKRVCMWIKNNFSPTPQVAFNKAYDPCVYGVIGRPYLNPKIKNFNEVLNKEILSGNQIQDEIGDIFNIWLAKNNGVDEINYPKQKPITLHEKPIKRTTRIGDNILDLFGGSGSTLMSAEQLGRKSFLMEIDPTFCQVIINRWEQHTNKKAKKII